MTAGVKIRALVGAGVVLALMVLAIWPEQPVQADVGTPSSIQVNSKTASSNQYKLERDRFGMLSISGGI